jgi:isoquinoline 1-oxidoreductase subunit beta
MADFSAQDIEAAAPAKRKGVKRRAFLIGGAVLLGGGAFGIYAADRSARSRAKTLTETGKDHNFLSWMKIAEDDTVTVYSPHIDFGQGSHTALGQMLAEELDADWSKVKVEQAPADSAFANTPLGRGFIAEMSGAPGFINALPTAVLSMAARSMPLQITGGSSAIRFTGQVGMLSVRLHGWR